MLGKVHRRDSGDRIEASICQCIVVRRHAHHRWDRSATGLSSKWLVYGGVGCGARCAAASSPSSLFDRLQGRPRRAAGEHGGSRPCVRENPALRSSGFKAGLIDPNAFCQGQRRGFRGRLVTKNFHPKIFKLPFKPMYEAINIIK